MVYFDEEFLAKWSSDRDRKEIDLGIDSGFVAKWHTFHELDPSTWPEEGRFNETFVVMTVYNKRILYIVVKNFESCPRLNKVCAWAYLNEYVPQRARRKPQESIESDSLKNVDLGREFIARWNELNPKDELTWPVQRKGRFIIFAAISHCATGIDYVVNGRYFRSSYFRAWTYFNEYVISGLTKKERAIRKQLVIERIGI